jgi:hypothetical protein
MWGCEGPGCVWVLCGGCERPEGFFMYSGFAVSPRHGLCSVQLGLEETLCKCGAQQVISCREESFVVCVC